ncbi:MAG TPA: hypothetical protein VLA24_10860 [Pseudomonadales bacterium]|nr:hypothetical protein [Pseudomonadales bacterium]
MSYLIIALVVAAVIGPVMWLRPNPREKQLLRLRAAARQAGLHVHLRALPPNHGEGDRTVEPAIMAYIRPWTEQERKSTLPERFTLPCVEGEWQCYRSRNRLTPEHFVNMPDSCRLLEVNSEGVIVYWRERGDESRVQSLAAAMEHISSTLLHHVGNKNVLKT